MGITSEIIVYGIIIITFLFLLFLILDFFLWRMKARNLLPKNRIIESIDGIDIEYMIKGSGKTILLCHGTPGGSDQIKLVQSEIPDGFEIIVPSRLGYLNSELKVNSFEEQADLFYKLLKKLNKDTICVVGTSGGGPTALYLAINYPEMVNCLILEAAITKQLRIPGTLANSFLVRFFLKIGFVDLFAWYITRSMKYFPLNILQETINNETNLESSDKKDFVNLINSDPERMAWFKKLINLMTPLKERIDGIRNDLSHFRNVEVDLTLVNVPTLIIHSPQDAEVTFDHAEHAKLKIKNSELIEVHGGHLMWIGKDRLKIIEKRKEFIEKHV